MDNEPSARDRLLTLAGEYDLSIEEDESIPEIVDRIRMRMSEMRFEMEEKLEADEGSLVEIEESLDEQ